ncbi:hypothetical protein EDD18DRAFT_860106 [Armillaria luteobubalina]|uniref:Uncharacterized protein n=1 Tax=Armillaria luteobubalina TaxID=153913 RepID=A0AA39UVU4_9AGAR|nr:hypothetical protein EDD18DRAFT_860106 [Armillaria luteobubalina]
MLRRLEKEISQLREDLEKTQVRSQEFEEKAERMAPIEAAWRRKLEQEAKAEASHSQLDTEEVEEEEIRDFAPGGILSRPSTSSIPDDPPPQVSSPSEEPSTQAQAPQVSNEPELAIVSQLLIKIQELEDANLRIMRQQSETANKLMAVQQETENMMIPASEKPRTSDDSTIRFKSFRKSLEGRPITDDSFLNLAGTHKSRKSVMGLFESPDRETSLPTSRKDSPHPLRRHRVNIGTPGLRKVTHIPQLFLPFISLLPLAPRHRETLENYHLRLSLRTPFRTNSAVNLVKIGV